MAAKNNCWPWIDFCDVLKMAVYQREPGVHVRDKHTTLSVMAALLKDFSSLSERSDRSEVEFCTKLLLTVYSIKACVHSYPSKFYPDGTLSAVERTAFGHNRSLTAAMTASVL